MARLTVGEEGVPISSFTVEFSPDSIGAALNAELADPLQEIDDTQDIIFEIGISNGGAFQWVPVMDVAKIDRVQSRIQFAGDLIKIRAASALSARFDLSPPTPIILFDPLQVSAVTDSASTFGDTVDEDHNFIEPERIAINSLDLQQLLMFIYQDKLGFDSVITNIGNFQIASVSIALTDTYHSVAAREIGLFEPTYHSDDLTLLEIMDPQGSIPTGLDTRELPNSKVMTHERDRQTNRLINQVILSYRDSLSLTPSEPTIVSEQEIKEVGTFGTIGWQRTVTTRFINEYHDNPDDITEVTRRQVFRVRNETSARADGLTRIVAVDDQTDTYKYDGRLKTGYTKTVQVYCKTPADQTNHLRAVQTETNQISWEELSSRPGEFIKRAEVTTVIGSVVKITIDEGAQVFSRQALYTANKLNDIPEDAELETNRPILTRIDVFREVGNDQIEVSSQQVSFLTEQSAPDLNRTVQHTGTIQANINPQASTVNMRILADDADEDELRPPLQISAGNIPFLSAKEIAERILARRGQAPTEIDATLAGLDLAMRRGSIRTFFDRADNEYRTFITGMSISGTNLGTPDFSVEMRARGVLIEA